jgi:hypothetical protein
MKAPLLAGLLLGFLQTLNADSNIVPEHSLSWAGNIGWLNWRTDSTDAVEVSASYCSGFVYSPNVGWIHLGKRPANGAEYSNQPGDYGVNISSNGDLSGDAYGANIGWIVFENLGSPKIDLATGKMSGHAYSANTGWISLADSTNYIQATLSPDPLDTDHDGIADTWEVKYAGGLSRFDAGSDSDSDGVTDLEEYRHGTDPLNPADPLQILGIRDHLESKSITITWSSVPLHRYSIESTQRLASDSWKQVRFEQGSPGTNTTLATVEITSDSEFFRVQTDQ